MLVISRNEHETIEVQGPCTITICRILGTKVKIGVTGEGRVLRGELAERKPDNKDNVP